MGVMVSDRSGLKMRNQVPRVPIHPGHCSELLELRSGASGGGGNGRASKHICTWQLSVLGGRRAIPSGRASRGKRTPGRREGADGCDEGSALCQALRVALALREPSQSPSCSSERLFSYLAAPAVNGSSQARDQIRATAVAMPAP